MAAGADFTAPLHVPLGATLGGIYFNGGPPDEFGNAPSGSGSLETADPHGDLTLVAASDVRVGSGHVRTVGGGSISITTRPGDLNSGDGNNWYDFTSAGYAVSPSGLDGIGTTAGGNVTLNAGRDLISVLPTVGAYGGGDVNLTAGRHILGRYLVSDGVGQMTSYTDVGGDNQGVTLANDVVLYPSAQGNLALATIAGGSLQGVGDAHHLVLSDSASPDYRTFLNGTKGLESKGVTYKPDGSYADPIHLGTASQPVQLDINGSVQDLQLQIPKAATLRVGGDALDFTYEGQNLTAQDVTILSVAGDIRMTSVNSRLWFGGPGKVNLFAGNLSLGSSAGSRSAAVAINPAVAIGADGQPVKASDLNVVVGYPGGNPAATPIAGAGNLNISASQIASFNGGSIAVHAAGSINVGSQVQASTDNTPKGIYTARGGNVTVAGLGDVVVSGSRIATYNGGDVTVISRNGGVDAGSGGKGFFSVSTLQYNPATHKVENLTDKFFGSGIVALTDPKLKDTLTPVGNITVTAAKDISANSGGVLQMGFNQSDIHNSFVSLESQQGSILANNSGILGANVRLKAAQDITGLVVANQDISVKANNNVSITALGGGNVSVNAGGNFSGTAVGGGAVDVSGLAISGTVFSAQGATSVSGDASNAKTSAFAGVAAPVASKATTDNDKPLAAVPKDDQEDPEQKKKKPIQLARTVSRVTVILPDKPK
jgi:hypothetical protein